ncbi:monooxygenase [Komagataeibacter nataicola]|uniref:Monooxygenase n=1 Tax=Komagataeibacter nataicola TaxID=265960 RepID=A0A9N7H3D0_9PROT|nr:FAD-dependent monooxygenase [Komagataeibacter nataicola]AQU89175.1 monooxygenase [Komagataeibacter nataicola]PYD66726.1 monooxygenase [Komagataeibacter nataicola]WEQ57050.1 FAD-dependent monooxygenase [Komagataeibacter nataicola]WNM08579.1 FAD-dependent monooxygenase [Komagataeibacter nataicola]GBR26211.1 monooxygenase FAD-binding [Komagataeibacter nataicola NRIC 0616]
MSKPVLVIGAGPVGLTMAAELARYGTSVRIIDRLPTRTTESRALAIWPRTLELLDAAGCADAFMATGLRANAVSIHAGNRVIARIPFGAIASPFSYLLMIPQSETERLLEEHLKTSGHTVERETELTDFVDRDDGVSCTLMHAGGRIETLEAAWLVGCDGAHSFVRGRLGLAFEGDTLPMGFVIADVHVTGLAIPPDEPAIFWHPDGAVMFFPIARGHYRIIADLGPVPLHMPDLGEMQAIVDRRGPGGVILSDPVWLSDFGVNERKVRDYRRGRVFLAGDAAHIHSPAGGQGMNMGMQDAFNLAWKLALVERQEAGPCLLNSYSIERSGVALQILSDSSRMTRIVLLGSHLAQRVRNFIVKQGFRIPLMRRAIASRLSGILIDYPDSPLNMGSARGLHGPGPGQRLIARQGSGQGNMPRFILAARDSAEARAIMARHASLLTPEMCLPPDENGIWLVRPDGYVAAVAKSKNWTVIDMALNRMAPKHRC